MDSDALFWTRISALGQIAGAVATLLAVWVALHLARSERRIRLRVSAQKSQIVSALGATATVSVTVQNIGLRQAKIDGIGWLGGLPSWQLPRLIRWAVPAWLRQRTVFQVYDYEWAINERFPWRLQPGESKTTHFRSDSFFEEFTETQGALFFREMPVFRKIVAVRPRVFAGVDTESISTGKIAPSLLADMRERFVQIV